MCSCSIYTYSQQHSLQDMSAVPTTSHTGILDYLQGPLMVVPAVLSTCTINSTGHVHLLLSPELTTLLLVCVCVCAGLPGGRARLFQGQPTQAVRLTRLVRCMVRTANWESLLILQLTAHNAQHAAIQPCVLRASPQQHAVHHVQQRPLATGHMSYDNPSVCWNATNGSDLRVCAIYCCLYWLLFPVQARTVPQRTGA